MAGDSDEQRRMDQSWHRFYGLQWLGGSPKLPTFIVLLQLAKPLASLMGDYLSHTGRDFERRQIDRARSAGDGASTVRDCLAMCPLLAAFNSTFEQACMMRAESLAKDSGSWDTVPVYGLTASSQSRAFCMLSTLACTCHKMLVFHKGYPFKMFSVIQDDAACDAIYADCPDRYDPWSAEIVKKFKDVPDRLKSAHAKAVLTSTLIVAKRDTASIEAGHASVRRALTANSVQTYTVQLKRASAQWTTQKMRRVWQVLRPGFVRPDKSAKRAAAKAAGTDARTDVRGHRASRGGAWRAFVREQCAFRRGSANFRELAHQYRGLDLAEKVRLATVGKQATQDAKDGKRPFGETAREADRRVKRLRVEHELQDSPIMVEAFIDSHRTLATTSCWGCALGARFPSTNFQAGACDQHRFKH